MDYDYVLFFLYIVPIIGCLVVLGPEANDVYRGRHKYKPKSPAFVLVFLYTLFFVPVLNMILLGIVAFDEYNKKP